MKEKMILILGILLFIILSIVTFMYFENKEDIYYTQIDNSNIKILDIKEDMKYEYTLDCYNESGKLKELSFKTSRELKNSAYLKLEVRTFGVHSWIEVSYEKLPDKVKEHYNNNED